MERMDDGQKTPCGHPDFNSYVKILCVFIWNGQTNRHTDRRTDKLIQCGLGNLIGSPSYIDLKCVIVVGGGSGGSGGGGIGGIIVGGGSMELPRVVSK